MGLEASVKLCVGPGSRLTPGQVLQEEGSPAASFSEHYMPQRPLSACGCSAQTPQFLRACSPVCPFPCG